MEELARLFGAKVVKLKDYDKINAIYLGLKKVREMECKPLVILEDLSKDEKNFDFLLLKDAEYISKDSVKKCDIYDPREPVTVGVKVFYVI